jgi:hypothetical protein
LPLSPTIAVLHCVTVAHSIAVAFAPTIAAIAIDTPSRRPLLLPLSTLRRYRVNHSAITPSMAIAIGAVAIAIPPTITTIAVAVPVTPTIAIHRHITVASSIAIAIAIAIAWTPSPVALP